MAMLGNHWRAADGLAARLGLAQGVRDSVEQAFERWDGKGVPKERTAARWCWCARARRCSRYSSRTVSPGQQTSPW
jgi:hypothetical protein